MTATSIFQHRFPADGRIVTTRLAAPELKPIIETLYRRYRFDEPGGGSGRQISLGRRGRTYLLEGPSGAWEAEGPGDAVLYYEWELTAALLADVSGYIRLHGAAVREGAGCLVLVGPSGAGKSTLSLGLHLDGRVPLADDALLLDPESGFLTPFDRSIRVHRSGLESLGVEPADVEGAHMCEPYLWLRPPGSGGTEACRPDAWVFLSSGPPSTLERLSAAATLGCLMAARLGGDPGRDFECLARLAEDVPGYRLSYASFPEALEQLRRL